VSVATLIVAVRTTGAASLTRLSAQTRVLGNNVNSLTRRLFAQTRVVSTVAGAYRGLNGLWYNANGTLVTQRNHIRNVTTAFGHLVNVLGGVASGFQALVSAGARLAPMLAVFAAKAAAIVAFGVPLAAALFDITGAIQLLAPAIIAVIATLVTLKMAFHGVGDAISAGLSDDTEKFAEALKKISPNAGDFAKSMVHIIKEWRAVQRATQDSFFGGGNLPHWLRRLSIEFKPIAQQWLPRIADGFSKAGAKLAEFLLQSGTKSQIVFILQNVDRFLRYILDSITPLTQAFLDIAEVAAPSLAVIGEKADGLATKFANWIRKAKESGDLDKWLENAKTTLSKLGEIAENTGRLLGAMFRSSKEEGQSMLDQLVAVTDKLADWAESDDGQQIIDVMAKIAAAIVAISPAIGLVMDVWSVFVKTGILMIQVMAAQFISVFGGIIRLAEKAARAVGMDGTADKLKKLGDDVFRFRDNVNNALGGIRDQDVNVYVRYKEVGRPPGLSPGEIAAGHSFRGYARGGQVRAGIPIIVGEKRPELFIPNSDGRILPRVPAATGSGEGGGFSLQYNGTARGMESMFLTWLSQQIRTGQLTLKAAGTRVVPA